MAAQQGVARVVTFTANPSIDRTVVLAGPLERGELQRAASIIEQGAGKGVNVARVVRASGGAVSTVAAAVDAPFQSLVEQGTPPLALVGVALEAGQRVRVNLTLTEPDGTTTKVNEPGPLLSAEQLQRASELLLAESAGAAWVALSGSLPPGAPENWYARLATQLSGLGCRVAIDTSDAALDAVLAALPASSFDLIKPNADELAQLTGGDASQFEAAAAQGDIADIVAAAARLRDRGIRNVLVTLGGAGAVLVNGEGAWHAVPPRITVRSTVGAGDSSVAGFILADVAGKSGAECLELAVSYGSAAASLPGTTLPTPGDLPRESVAVSAVG